MKKYSLTEWSAIAEIVASVAVVISLLFVGFQVQRNTAELQAAQSNDLFDSLREIELTMLAEPHLTEVYTKGWTERRIELTEEQNELFQIYLLQSFTILEQAYQRMLDGTMSDAEYRNWEELFVQYLAFGVSREDMDYMLPWMSTAFREELRTIAERHIE